jgi:hypothetical protein
MSFHHDETGTIIGYIWPKLTRCPHCGVTDYEQAGYVRNANGLGMACYRRCANPDKPTCPSRASPYKVLAIGAHVDRGGDQSEVIEL